MSFINQCVCGQKATGIRSALSQVQPSLPHRPLLYQNSILLPFTRKCCGTPGTEFLAIFSGADLSHLKAFIVGLKLMCTMMGPLSPCGPGRSPKLGSFLDRSRN